MANLHLVTGYAGREHVTAADQGAFNVAMLGSGQFVMDKGKKFAASIVSNNQVRVLDGDIYMQGRFIRLNEGSYADLVIENGTQGYQRNDLIVARYTKAVETGIEEVNLVVIKGTAVASNPKDPSYSNGNIIEGKAYLNDMPLYRVAINGLTVQSLVPLFTVKNCTALMRDGSNAMKTNLIVESDGYVGVRLHDTRNDTETTFCGDNGVATMFTRDVWDSLRWQRALNLKGYKNANSIADALILQDKNNPECIDKEYTILHTGNKTSGSYTGNGDATVRTIDIGGIGGVCEVYNGETGAAFAFVTGGGAMICNNAEVGDFSIVHRNIARLDNGVLRLATTARALNENGHTYFYQVL